MKIKLHYQICEKMCEIDKVSFLLSNQLYQLTLDIATKFWLTDSCLRAMNRNA